MNQLTRFFRFVIPGGFFVIYFVLFSTLFGVDLSELYKILKVPNLIIAIFIPTIGYFASTMHHLIYNCKWNWTKGYRINFPAEFGANYDDQWATFNIAWRLHSKHPWYPELHSRNNSLTDILHGNGAIFMSFILATLAIFSLLFFENPPEKMISLECPQCIVVNASESKISFESPQCILGNTSVENPSESKHPLECPQCILENASESKLSPKCLQCILGILLLIMVFFIHFCSYRITKNLAEKYVLQAFYTMENTRDKKEKANEPSK